MSLNCSKKILKEEAVGFVSGLEVFIKHWAKDFKCWSRRKDKLIDGWYFDALFQAKPEKHAHFYQGFLRYVKKFIL